MKVLESLTERVVTLIRGRRINEFALLSELFSGKKGIEIGGPSKIFRNRGFIPLYKIVKELDGCNYANATLWDRNKTRGKEYIYNNNKKGIQYISEATDLSFSQDYKYDFLVSAHCLEHVANPLKAMEEWIRIVKKGGHLLLVLPNKEFCFDHKRPVTKFAHLMEDYRNNTKDDDMTHLAEILKLHDLRMDRSAGTFEQFSERSLKNPENRALHQHIFDMAVIKEIFNHFNLEILLTFEGREYIIAGKVNAA